MGSLFLSLPALYNKLILDNIHILIILAFQVQRHSCNSWNMNHVINERKTSKPMFSNEIKNNMESEGCLL